MKIDLKLHKTIKGLNKIKMSSLTLFFAFISSFNFWFLSIFFFSKNFFIEHGIIITLMTTFVFTISWCLIAIITVPKDFLLFSFVVDDLSGVDALDNNNNMVNIFIFSEIILLHCFFSYLAYMCSMSFCVFFSTAFITNVFKYLLTDFSLKKEYVKFLDRQKHLKNN